MKILHIISSGGMYGAEAVILNLSRALQQSGHTSILGVFNNTSNPNFELHEAATKEGIVSHLIPCSGQIDRSVAGKLRELVRETQPDVVHAHGYKADLYVYFALRRSGIPLTSTCHTWYDNDLMVTLYGAADRWALRRYAAVIGVSDEVVQQLKQSGVRQERIHEIRNGIDLRPFDGVPPSLSKGHAEKMPLVGLVGRLAREKGIDIFLHAAALVLQEEPGTHFVVVGDGPDRVELESLARALKVEERVKFLGRRDDMPGVYASLGVMVSASRQEGLPMALLEGMASRRALVATSVGEVPTLVEDDVTGVLVRPEDEAALAAAILALLRDPDRRERLASAARERVESEFSAARMSADYLAIYEAVARPRGAHVPARSRGPR